MRGDRGDVDDAAAAGAQHVAADFGAGEEDARQVGVHDRVVVGSGERLRRLEDRRALRVDENVDAPMSGENALDGLGQGFRAVTSAA
jgi:hypothetical protein